MIISFGLVVIRPGTIGLLAVMDIAMAGNDAFGSHGDVGLAEPATAKTVMVAPSNGVRGAQVAITVSPVNAAGEFAHQQPSPFQALPRPPIIAGVADRFVQVRPEESTTDEIAQVEVPGLIHSACEQATRTVGPWVLNGADDTTVVCAA